MRLVHGGIVRLPTPHDTTLCRVSFDDVSFSPPDVPPSVRQSQPSERDSDNTRDGKSPKEGKPVFCMLHRGCGVHVTIAADFSRGNQLRDVTLSVLALCPWARCVPHLHTYTREHAQTDTSGGLFPLGGVDEEFSTLWTTLTGAVVAPGTISGVESIPTGVLVTGAAGVGKTTLTLAACQKAQEVRVRQ